jgi:hypothetical protein
MEAIGVRWTARRSTKGIGPVEVLDAIFGLPYFKTNQSIAVPAAPSFAALDDGRYDAMEDSAAPNNKKLDAKKLTLLSKLYLVAQRFHFILG